MPSLLERKDLLHQLARSAVDAADHNVAHEPARSDHPLSKLAPNGHVVVPQPKAPETREEAERKGEQAADAAKAMERIASAYTEGHGARTAEDMLKDKGQPIPHEIQHAAKAEKQQQSGKAREGSGELSDFNKNNAPRSPAEAGPAQQQQQHFTTLYPTLVCTGITNEQADARSAAQQLTGHGDDQHALAAYDPNAGFVDAARDLAAVKRYAHLAEQVTVDDNGQVVMDYDRNQTYNRGVGVGGLFTTWYQSPAELGAVGADKVLSQMQGQGPGQKPPDTSQFISIQAHSGGGQSAFFTLVELHQRGYRNLSLVGYEMALTPHEREVLEKLGVQVTNFSGRNGNAVSATGNDLRMLMGGGRDTYDCYIDRPGESTILGGSMHSMVPGDSTGQTRANLEKTTAMVQFTVWLDSQGLHQQWTPENFERFKQETGYTPSQDPLGGNNIYQPHTPAARPGGHSSGGGGGGSW